MRGPGFAHFGAAADASGEADAQTTDMTQRLEPKTASEWIVALNDDPEDDELRACHERWLEADDANRRDWDETLRVWRLMAMTVPAHIDQWDQAAQPSQDAPVSRRPLRRQSATRSTRRRRAAAIAAAAVAACLSLVFLPGLIDRLRADHVTATAEIREIELPDGSRLTLAPDSAVDVAFSSNERQVRLLRGQAFFDVESDPAKPFSVAAGNAQVTVLGTAFDVATLDDGVQVAVEKGVVRVTAVQGGYALDDAANSVVRPGQSARIGEDGAIDSGPMPHAQIASWRRGVLVANDRAVSEVVEIVDRYFSGAIVVAAPGLSGRSLTGVYKLDNPEAALRAIADAHGATVRKASPWLLILSPF